LSTRSISIRANGVEPAAQLLEGPEDEKIVVFGELSLPPGMTVPESDIAELHLVDEETGVQYEPTNLGPDDLGPHRE